MSALYVAAADVVQMVINGCCAFFSGLPETDPELINLFSWRKKNRKGSFYSSRRRTLNYLSPICSWNLPVWSFSLLVSSFIVSRHLFHSREPEPLDVGEIPMSSLPLWDRILVACRVTFVVALAFWSKILERSQRPTNGTLSFFDCGLSGRDTQRWWWYWNPSCYNKICLNFFHSDVIGMLKHLTHAPCALAPQGAT